MPDIFQPDLIAVDGNSLLHRAFYALPDMRSKDGTPTGAIYGFLSMLLPLFGMHPKYFIVAFDKHGPTFRHSMYSEYKAGRKETPEDLRKQFPIVKELLAHMGIFTYELESYEADDILGTVSLRFENMNMNTLIVSGDRDGFQLVSEKVHLLLTKKGISESIEYTPELLMETYGLRPEIMKDLKALMGDSSDHIPGIAGVGEKTALQLLHTYGSLNGIFENVESLKGKLKDKINSGKEDALLSYRLGTINRKIPEDISIDDIVFKVENLSNGMSFLEELNMNSMVAKFQGFTDSAEKQSHPTEIRTITSEAELSNVIKEILEKKSFSFLLQPELSIAIDRNTSYIFSKGETLFDEGISIDTALYALKSVFENELIEKVTFDLKSSLQMIEKLDIEINGKIHDCVLAEYLLNATDKALGLKDFSEKYSFLFTPYASCLYEFSAIQKKSLEDTELLHLYEDIEIPFLYVLRRMEKAGFGIDTDILNELGNKYRAELKKLESEIYSISGCEFNILSP